MFKANEVDLETFIDPITLKIYFILPFGIRIYQIVKLARLEVNQKTVKEAKDLVNRFFKSEQLKVLVYEAGKSGRYLIDCFNETGNLSKQLLEKGYCREFKVKRK